MSGARELPAFAFDVAAYAGEWVYVWGPQFHPSTGVAQWDFNLDVRNVVAAAGGGAINLKPALQFVSTRVDRPDDGSVITAGSVVTTAGVTKFTEVPSGIGTKFFWRAGVGFKLASGTFVRAQGHLYTAFRTLGMVLPAEEIVFNPLNDNTDWSVFPFAKGKPIPTSGVDKAKLVVLGSGNVTATMEWQLLARFYNDLMARGDWTPFGAVGTPAAGGIDVNTGEIAFTGITLTNYQWMDLALGVRKSGGAASRCIFHVVPALKYV